MTLSSLTKQSTGRDGQLAADLGRRIRAARVALGMSQAELGRPLTRAYVSQVESGQTLPSLPAFLHLADRLGVDPCWLLSSTESGLGRYTPVHDHHDSIRRAPPS
jgi:transcriptional regulator with XRE-family HTH domain